MKHLVCLLGVLVPSAALAQGMAPASPPPPPPPPAAHGMWIGGSAELTFGNEATGDNSQQVDLVSTWAIMGTFDYQINDILTFRAMPRYESGLKPEGETESVSLTDLRAGITAGKGVSPVMRAYGLAALGYGHVSFPSSSSSGGGPDSASGLTLTFGGGVSYAFSPTLRLVVELAYEKGMESVSFMGQSSDFNINGVELGFGIQAGIGG